MKPDLHEIIVIKIEDLRNAMYHAYKHNNYEETLKISQELDKVMNQVSRYT